MPGTTPTAIWSSSPATRRGTELKYVGGEFGALQRHGNLAVATFDKSVRRPYRNELTVGLDHELFPGPPAER